MFDIKNTTRRPVPNLPFRLLKETVLGKQYDLSLVIAGDERTKKLNVEHRRKSYTPNVLSFPLSKTSGEIFLNLRQAEREVKKYGLEFRAHTALLVVHSLLHLAGYTHGSRMDGKEAAILKRFSLLPVTMAHGTKHHHRN
jgi:probable rRNA maturation factor